MQKSGNEAVRWPPVIASPIWAPLSDVTRRRGPRGSHGEKRVIWHKQLEAQEWAR